MLAVFTHEVPETSLLSRKAGFPNFFPLLDQFIELAVLLDVECITDTHSCAEKRTKIEIEVLSIAEHNEGPAFVFNHLVQEEIGLSHLLLGILDIQGSISPLNSAMPLLLALLPPQQSDFSRHRTWGFAHSCRWVGVEVSVN